MLGESVIARFGTGIGDDFLKDTIKHYNSASFSFYVKAPRYSQIEDVQTLPEKIEQSFAEMVDNLSASRYKPKLHASVETVDHNRNLIAFEIGLEAGERISRKTHSMDDTVRDIKYVLEHKLGLEHRMGFEVTGWAVRENTV